MGSRKREMPFLVNTHIVITRSLPKMEMDEEVAKMVSLFKYIDEISQG